MLELSSGAVIHKFTIISLSSLDVSNINYVIRWCMFSRMRRDSNENEWLCSVAINTFERKKKLLLLLHARTSQGIIDSPRIFVRERLFLRRCFRLVRLIAQRAAATFRGCLISLRKVRSRALGYFDCFDVKILDFWFLRCVMKKMFLVLCRLNVFLILTYRLSSDERLKATKFDNVNLKSWQFCHYKSNLY